MLIVPRSPVTAALAALFTPGHPLERSPPENFVGVLVVLCHTSVDRTQAWVTWFFSDSACIMLHSQLPFRTWLA